MPAFSTRSRSGLQWSFGYSAGGGSRRAAVVAGGRRWRGERRSPSMATETAALRANKLAISLPCPCCRVRISDRLSWRDASTRGRLLRRLSVSVP